MMESGGRKAQSQQERSFHPGATLSIQRFSERPLDRKSAESTMLAGGGSRLHPGNKRNHTRWLPTIAKGGCKAGGLQVVYCSAVRRVQVRTVRDRPWRRDIRVERTRGASSSPAAPRACFRRGFQSGLAAVHARSCRRFQHHKRHQHQCKALTEASPARDKQCTCDQHQ